MKSYIYIVITLLVLSSNINAVEKTVDELALIVANASNTEMKYFFWAQGDERYLAKIKEDATSFGVWSYTRERKWQPIHNADAFNGFPLALKSFENITIDRGGETITFSSIIDGSISGVALEKARVIENKTIKIGWYFWLQDNHAFLLKKISDNEISIWNYTDTKKWRPIHNADAFDGYPIAPNTLSTTTFSPAQGTLSTGVVIPTGSSSNTNEPQANTTATYKLVFNATWSSSTHPKNFPSNPHFSPLVGGLHNDKTGIWKREEIASEGIKVMAETGSRGTLINMMKSNENINLTIKGSPLNPSPKQISLTFEAKSGYPYLSIVSMLAPSPDWFIGVNSLKLLDDNGSWIEGKTIDLKLYDAGTDSGKIFNSSNIATLPREPIKTLSDKENTDFEDGKPFVGQFIITKQ